MLVVKILVGIVFAIIALASGCFGIDKGVAEPSWKPFIGWLGSALVTFFFVGVVPVGLIVLFGLIF